jgi:glycosyltransferase
MITIITTVKDNFKGIHLTINSILNQKNIKFEYIIIDGNSSDYTAQVITDLIKGKKNIKYIRMKDKNLYHGINRGIKAAKGELIGILNSGDIYFTEWTLSEIYKIYKSKESIDVISGNLIFYNFKSISRVWRMPIRSKITKWNALKLAHPATFIRKTIYDKILYDHKNYKISADTDFFMKIFPAKNINFLYLDKFLIFMKDGGVSTTLKNLPRKMYEDIKILYKHFGLLSIIAYLNKIIIKIPNFRVSRYKKFYKVLINRISTF